MLRAWRVSDIVMVIALRKVRGEERAAIYGEDKRIVIWWGEMI